MKKKQVRHDLEQFFAANILFLLIGGVFLVVVLNLQVAKSWLIGGTIHLIPQALFATVFFYYQGALKAKKIAQCFYVAEVIKLFATLILFGSVFLWVDVVPSALFAGFVLSQGVMWFFPWIVNDGFK
jgi:F0F1-type ATP synthase assembly protein I